MSAGVGYLRTITRQPNDHAALADLLSHFFTTLLEECPACGSRECERWQFVREIAPPSLEQVEAIRGAGVGPR